MLSPRELVRRCVYTCTGSAAIIGDVNLFFHEYLLEEGEAKFSVAEIEVMVAVTAARRRGHATEAVLLMMHYGVVEI